MTTRSKPLGQIISESVRTKHKAWPLDLNYSPNPSHEDGFKRHGDSQRVLWQIHDCARDGNSIPEWAATAFCDALVRVMTCQSTWQQEFGDVPARGRKHRPQKQRSKLRHLAKNLIRVGEAVQDYRGPKDDEMWRHLGKKLGLGRAVMKDYWGRYRLAHNL
jgi:hypothetical protein